MHRSQCIDLVKKNRDMEVFAVREKATVNILCMRPYDFVGEFLWGTYPGRGLLGRWIVNCTEYWEIATWNSCLVDTSPWHLMFSNFVIFADLMGVKWYIIVGLICFSVITNEVEYLFIYLWAISVSSSINFLFIDFARFSIGFPKIFLSFYFLFFLLVGVSLDINVSPVLDIFSQSTSCEMRGWCSFLSRNLNFNVIKHFMISPYGWLFLGIA